jgi:protein O-mannosyl-transferase
MMNEKNNSNRNLLIMIKIILVIILFLFPIIYLIYTTANLPEKPRTLIASTQSVHNIAILEKAVKGNPTVENLISLSIVYINKQMPGKSIDHLKKAIELDPANAIAYNNLGAAYIMLQQYQNGIDACNKALAIDPNFQLAKNNLKWGKDEKQKVLREIKLQEHVSASEKDVSFYSAYGFNYYKIGEYGKSIEIWNKIFEIEPKNTTALNSIGTAFMMKGQIDDAILLFKKATELEPENQLAKNNLAWALSEKNKQK